jgi:hypothetical protein
MKFYLSDPYPKAAGLLPYFFVPKKVTKKPFAAGQPLEF